MWKFELWEFNQCVREYNLIQEEQSKKDIAQAWRTANFTGAVFAGKLKKLKEYLAPIKAETAPKISKEEFELKLAKAQEGGAGNADA